MRPSTGGTLTLAGPAETTSVIFDPLATGVLTAGSVRSTVFAGTVAFGSEVHGDVERVGLGLRARAVAASAGLAGHIGHADLIGRLRHGQDDGRALLRRLAERRVGAQHLARLDRRVDHEHGVG